MNILIFFLEGDYVDQDAPNRRRAGAKMAQRHQGEGPGGGLRRGYISRQVAKSLEDRQVEVRRRMAVWIEARTLQPSSSTPVRRAAAE